MKAELSQLLARAIQSPYYRSDATLFANRMAIKSDVKTWLTEQAIAAYTVEKLPPDVQEFLRECDRSWQIEQKLFAGKPANEWDDKKVLEAMFQ